jgi:hypothetical protein
MEKINKIQAPADFWGDAMLLAATLKAINGTAAAHPAGCIGYHLGMLKKCEELAKRIESRIDISIPPKAAS